MTLLSALMLSGCGTPSPVYDSRPEVRLSQRVRSEANRGPYAMPPCAKGDALCGQRAVVELRRSEIRKSSALQAAVRAVDRAAPKKGKRK